MFSVGLLAGIVYFAGTVYWTKDVMAVYGGLPVWQAVPVAGLLVAFLALYPALFFVVTTRLLHAFGARALFAAPAVWVATEFARGTLFTGFPWVLLGYSQVEVLPVAQAASIVGVYGLSFLVALVSAAATFALGPRPHRFVPLGVALGLLAVIAVWGAGRVRTAPLTRLGEEVRVGVVQGNVPQEQKWDGMHRQQIFERYLALTKAAAAEGARLVVWPESATPFMYLEDANGRAALQATVRESGASLLFGSDQIERDASPRFFNSAFLVASDGQTLGVYRKTHLVPFGEYVPLRTLLFFAAPLVEAVGDFSAGESVAPLSLGAARVGVAICYEIVFPSLVRESVELGSTLLTTLTNDAWYGWSSAPFQHFAQARMRAIENGRYLIRAANTGISAIVDPYGRAVTRSALFETRLLVAPVRLLSERTIYARIGDVVAYASVAITGLAYALARRAPQ